jgi:diguanylate cyclase (GGDEF)-like protein
MWFLIIRSPLREPSEYIVPTGKTTLGRKSDNDIVIADAAASRFHAELDYDPKQDALFLRDLGSTNGTFVNREHLTQSRQLAVDDQIRIGQHLIRVSRPDQSTPAETGPLADTQPLTLGLLLQAVDQHAVLLYEVAHRLNTVLDLQTILREVSKLMRISMGAEKCEVILAEHFERLAELGFPTSIARQAIEQRSIVVIPDLAAGANHALGDSSLLLQIRFALCVPVMLEEEVVALTYVYKTGPSSRPFSQPDVQLAVAISHQAALAIQRARLLENARRLEQLATIDSATGLYNRRHIFELAEQEFQRARRHNRPLSALMLDIDDYKQINDGYGHGIGDQVLQAVAERSRKHLRAIDLMGRYGGDEFVVLLPETALGEARNIAERLRKSIADVPAVTDQGPLSITISLGAATLAADCLSLTALLSDADAALYAAKKAGKNRVEVIG